MFKLAVSEDFAVHVFACALLIVNLSLVVLPN